MSKLPPGVFRRSAFIKIGSSFLLLICSLGLCLPALVKAQDDTIRVETDLVLIPATVLSREGRYVTNLKKEDFRVYENDVEQPIEHFESIEEPFTILFLIDNSSSMAPYLLSLTRTANAFARQMRPDDRLIAATYSDAGRVEIVLEATKKGELRRQITLKARRSDGRTTTFDAVDYGLKYMKKFPGRRAIVLFSDGELNGIMVDAKSNLRAAEKQEALVYTIKFGKFPDIPPDHPYKTRLTKGFETISEYLNGLSGKTGGRSFQVENITDLEKTFNEVAADLRRQYRLGYYAGAAGKEGERRRIRVEPVNSNLKIRAKTEVVYNSRQK